MKRFFFSLRASYLLFAVLALVFGLGNRLASVTSYKAVFKDMTATHLGNCIGPIAHNPILLVWLFIFILVGGCLFINTGCCTTAQVRLLGRMRAGHSEKQGRAVQMAVIHIIALMVIALHALDITMIKRQKPVRLYPGQTVSMGAYTVRVDQVSYVTDRAMITEDRNTGKNKRFHIPEEKFSMENNFARIRVEKDNLTSGVRELRILCPVRLGADFFFLDGFFIAHGSTEVGVLIHHSYNPLAIVFFTVYTLLFGLLIFRYFSLRSAMGQKERS